MKDFPIIIKRQTEIKSRLTARAKIIQAARDYFIRQDYLEVETPIRTPAPAPEAYIDAPCSEDWFLQTSPELYMKRLLASGYGRIFQICKCFRSGERGKRHISEFTMLEWYRAGINYLCLMKECEDMISDMAQSMGYGHNICWQGKNISLKRPWHRIKVQEAFQKYASISMDEALEKDSFDEIIAFEIEPELGNDKPVFLYDYPLAKGAFAKVKKDETSFTERFELYMGGTELANGFSEINDPYEQRSRFSQEIRSRNLGGKIIYPMPEKFLQALEYMPESSGIALGMDRLVMLFTDSGEIDKVVSFITEEL